MQAPLQKMKYIFPVPNHHTYMCTLDEHIINHILGQNSRKQKQ